MDLVVEDENESSSSSSEDVGKRSLEESSGTLVRDNLSEAVNGSLVLLLFNWSSRLHHESSSHSIEWVGNDTGSGGHGLSEHPHSNNVGLLDVFKEESFSSIEKTEVGSSVEEDTNNRDLETLVKSTCSVLSGNLSEAVNETSEFSIGSASNISSKSGSSEIEWVDNAEGSRSSHTSGHAVSDEEFSWLSLWVEWAEDLLVGVLEGEVKSLSWEISHDIGQVSSPERGKTLLGLDSSEAVSDTLVFILWSDGGRGILNLKKKFYSLNWSDSGLRDSSGDSSDEEVSHEGLLFLCLLLVRAHIQLIYGPYN